MIIAYLHGYNLYTLYKHRTEYKNKVLAYFLNSRTSNITIQQNASTSECCSINLSADETSNLVNYPIYEFLSKSDRLDFLHCMNISTVTADILF